MPQSKIGNMAKIHTNNNKKNHNIMKNIFLWTPSKPGVLLKQTFFHTPDEARSVGLAKACVL